MTKVNTNEKYDSKTQSGISRKIRKTTLGILSIKEIIKVSTESVGGQRSGL